MSKVILRARMADLRKKGPRQDRAHGADGADAPAVVEDQQGKGAFDWRILLVTLSFDFYQRNQQGHEMRSFL